MPGPKEADPDQVQRYMRVLVNELIRLWKYGAMVPTPKYPKGRRIRVILVGVVCDKPAAHKLGGFGSHAHTYFCIQDWISQTFKATVEAFKANAFRTRTDAEHRSFMAQYQQCSSKGEREDFARKYATRWSELARLPYFDMCRMIVVDPMHNLFLGLVKTHFYHIWVQLKILRKTKELRQLHSVLEKLELPATLGRLPRLIGEPAGGSLTADQWLILATVIGPLVIPDIWRDCAPDPDGSRLQQRLSALTGVAAKRRAQRTTRYAAPGGKAGSKRKRTSGRVKKRAPKVSSASRTDISGQDPLMAPRRTQRVSKPTEKRRDMVLESDDDGGIEIDAEENWSDDSSDGDDAWSAQASIHERDVPNFLKLAEALTTFLADELSEDDVMIADQRLREYCTELLELYGPAIIRPNHHYATHTGDFVLDYGPLREFWTFVFERLNKVLKSFKTTGRAGGELECSFFREFHRSVRLHRLLVSGLDEAADPGLQASCDAMLAAAADDRGTLQNLVQDLDNTFADKGKICELSRRASREMFPEDLYYTLLKHVQSRHPLQQFHSFISLAPSPTSTLVPNIATFFDYAIIHGHRYYASRRTISPRNSLALVQWNTSGSPSQRRHAGEITDIFMFEHPSVGAVYLAAVRWFRTSSTSIADTPWASQGPVSRRSCSDMNSSSFDCAAPSIHFRSHYSVSQYSMTAGDEYEGAVDAFGEPGAVGDYYDQASTPTAVKDNIHPSQTKLKLLLLVPRCPPLNEVDSPTLSLMVPLLSRGLNEKLTATKRKVAVIIDKTAKVVDSPVTVRPFIPKLLPGLIKIESVIGDPVARSVVARAIATLRQVGEVPTGDGSDLPPLKKAEEKTLAHSLIDLYKKAGANPVPSVADVATIYASQLATNMVNVKKFEVSEWQTLIPYLVFLITSPDPNTIVNKWAVKSASAEVEDETQAEDEDEGEDLCNCQFSLAYGAKILLNTATVRVKRGHRYGLCGRNGTGKSTLMRVITDGQVEGFPSPDEVRTFYVEHGIDGSEANASVLVFIISDKCIQATHEEIIGTFASLGFSDEHQNLTTCTSIIVSHDSGLLINVITDVLHLIRFKLKRYRGILDAYMKAFKLPDPPLLEGVKTEKSLLKMRKVGFQYSTQANQQLYDITLQVSLSSHVAVLGPNGSGKSCLSTFSLATHAPLLTGSVANGHICMLS
ncbi:hypothetical protein BD310DRAFT_981846 [Dichomitus squalens]|uniref:ABC transporter domain-containing protein n=1 Tax=Dichomitus squalens TaxID=114155 RepID=A0A4Q9PGL7_9APHY|nr:hypothetical protein BD310DRAFT_981846 [Dichomitus squalens]